MLKIAEAEAQLPGWLFADYRAIYEQMDQVVATVQSQQPVQPSTELSPPDFGVFPATLQELVGNRIQLNRLLGLSKSLLY